MANSIKWELYKNTLISASSYKGIFHASIRPRRNSPSIHRHSPYRDLPPPRRSYLLLKGAPTKRLWANQYNGLGGHVERGEAVLTSAKRELLEEAGLTTDLWLCGTLIVDVGVTGICLYFFSGECLGRISDPQPSAEGLAESLSFDEQEKI